MLLEADRRSHSGQDSLPAERPRLHGAPVACLVLLSLLYGALYLHAGRLSTFYSDEWAFILGRRGWSIHDLIAPHNEHPSLPSLLAYKLLLPTVGLKHYWVFRLLSTGLHIACSWLVFLYARRRVDQWFAFGLAAVLLAFGSGWENILWPFQVGWLVSVAAGISAFMALERNTRNGNIAAALLIMLSLASSGVGLAFAVGVTAEVIRDRTWRRRSWITVLPLFVTAVWATVERPLDHTSASLEGALKAPTWSLNLAAAGVGDLFGQSVGLGRPLLIAIVVGAVVLFLRNRTVAPRTVALLVTLGAFLAMAAIARADTNSPATESRYVYLICVLLLLTAAELLRDRRKPPAWAVVAVCSLAAFSAVSNLSPLLLKGAPLLRLNASLLHADLTAIELASGHVKAGFVADREVSAHVAAGPYLAASRSYGSAAWPLTSIAGLEEAKRRRIDDTAAAALGITPLRVKSAVGHDCRTGGSSTWQVPGAGLVIRTQGRPANVRLRRFADGWEAGPATPGRTRQPESAKPFVVQARSTVTLVIPADRSPARWWAHISSTQPVEVCERSG